MVGGKRLLITFTTWLVMFHGINNKRYILRTIKASSRLYSPERSEIHMRDSLIIYSVKSTQVSLL